MNYETIRVMRSEERNSGAAQTQYPPQKTGVEALQLWMERVTWEPGKSSGAHHHGEAETAEYILSGHTRIYYGQKYEKFIDLGPGDFVFAPPFVPHIERNMSDTEPVIFIAAGNRGNNVIHLDENKADQDTLKHLNNSEIKIVRASELDTATNQIENLPMRTAVETSHLWMGRVTGTPGTISGAHHHGDAETGVYILSGRTRIYYGEGYKEYVELESGDLMYVPPFIPHIERNMGTEPVEFVVVRIPKNIVINLEGNPG